MSRTFHVLSESEPFAQHSYGSIARWVANILQSENDGIVLAPSTDDSWPLDRDRVRIVKGLSSYKSFFEGGGYLLPLRLLTSALRNILSKPLQDLQAGDTVWVHDRPEFALAIAPLVRQRGARLFLHVHTANLMQASAGIMRAFNADCYIFNSLRLEREALQMFPFLGRTEVLSTGLDSQSFHPAVQNATFVRPATMPEELATVVFSAHMARKDDLKIFLKAMEILEARHVPVRGLVVHGASAASREPTPIPQERRVPANVSFETFASPAALGKKLRASELFCVPSSWHKSASLHMLEALACGLPIVATENANHHQDTAGAPGILVIPTASERLAQTIQNLVEDSSARQHMAQTAYNAYAGNLMWSPVRAAYMSLLAPANFNSQPDMEFLPELLSA
jgi:spore coat protein SA